MEGMRVGSIPVRYFCFRDIVINGRLNRDSNTGTTPRIQKLLLLYQVLNHADGLDEQSA